MSTRTPSVFPVLRYRDARSAVEFLAKAFGFSLDVCYPEAGPGVDHAELSFGNGAVMVGSVREGAEGPMAFDPHPQILFVVVDDPDAHCERARAAGAEIVAEPTDQDYGSREYVAKDPEGNLWGFGTYWRDAASG